MEYFLNFCVGHPRISKSQSVNFLFGHIAAQLAVSSEKLLSIQHGLNHKVLTYEKAWLLNEYTFNYTQLQKFCSWLFKYKRLYTPSQLNYARPPPFPSQVNYAVPPQIKWGKTPPPTELVLHPPIEFFHPPPHVIKLSLIYPRSQ